MVEAGAGPVVSVLIPAYNGSITIERTLRSVLCQDMESEIIIVDDSSSDLTLRTALNILKPGGHPYKVVEHQSNKGLSASLNDGLAIANGDYVLVLHQDCELMKSNWISTAVKSMNSAVAVVTGYYGIFDPSEMNLAKKTFGLLRRQIHSRPVNQIETVNFSEGKCDLYNKKVLESIGGFPTRYRIAGEDLSVSVRFRQKGYSILKNYDLPVVQRYGGKAESFIGNFRKEFDFGRAMGGVLGEHKSSVFNGLESGYSRARTTHRAGQAAYTAIFFLFMLLYLITLNPLFLIATLLSLGSRYVYYALIISTSLREERSLSKHRFIDTLWMPLFGMVSDPIYSLGLLWGILKWAGGRQV